MANPHLEFTIEGSGARATLELGDTITEASIGRSSDCSLVLPSGSVSRRHARVIRQGRDFAIEDLGSSNGTFVNGARLEAPRVLNDQDEVKVGSILGRFVKPPEAPAIDATVAFGSGVAATLMAPPKPPPAAAPPQQGPTRSLVPSVLAQAAGTATTQMPQSDPASESGAQTSPPMTPPTFAGSTSRGAGDSDTGPGFVELAAIAAGSFFVVFAIGAAVMRFLL